MRTKNSAAFLALLLIVLALLSGCQKKTGSTTNNDASTTVYIQPTGNSNAEETTVNNTVYDVHFFNENGKQISEDTGKNTEIEFPSLEEVERPGYIFTGWDTNINTMQKKDQPQEAGATTTTSKVEEKETGSTDDPSRTQENQEEPQSVDIKPVYVDVRKMDNVVAMPAVYGNAGSQFTVPLTLCGKVNLCGIDLCVHYNRNKLKLVKFENADKDVICNTDEEKGDFHLNYISTTNVTEEIHFCDLVFEVIRETGGEEDLNIEIIEIVAFDENNDLITPKTNVIDAKIYAY